MPGEGGLHAQGLNAQQGGHVNATFPGGGGVWMGGVATMIAHFTTTS